MYPCDHGNDFCATEIIVLAYEGWAEGTAAYTKTKFLKKK